MAIDMTGEIQGLIDNASTQYSEDDRDWLSTLEESQLAKMSPTVNEEVVTEEVVEEETVPAVGTIGTVIGDTQEPVSTAEYIKNAPDEIQAVLNSGLQLHRARKDLLVKGILANARNQFSQVQLESKDLGELEGMAALATDISYEGAGAALTTLADDNMAPAPPQLFDLNAANTA